MSVKNTQLSTKKKKHYFARFTDSYTWSVKQGGQSRDREEVV